MKCRHLQLYVPVVNLPTQNTINWNKHKSKKTNQAQNRYLDLLIHPSFQEVNRLFVLSFENEEDQESYKKRYLPTVEIKDAIIDVRNFLIKQ